ncbi:E3 ubiquitin-protein ligase PHF7-like [Strix uralensis]|uniref:E3 ubiquitin-protein ligase PHF7-like n=1 Tax=Strix uralensis TaxID=36305 RepID=UPI003DA61588
MKSFCGEHSPEQAAEVAPEEEHRLPHLPGPCRGQKSYGTMVCPACKHAWFHRGCIQGQAVRDGISCFRSPLCRDRDAFSSEMLSMGIRIPFRLPSQDPHAYDDLSERHSRCDACECLCPGGREQAEAQGPWQLLLCCSCAAEGTHRRCSQLRTSTASWECNSCAGLGTVSSGSSELTGPSTSSQSALGQSHSTPVPESSCPSTTRQAASHNPLGWKRP